MFDGPGGVSCAAVDMARLLAMLSCRSNNPVLSPGTIDDFLTDAVAAYAPPTGDKQGYRGFDVAKGALPHVELQKGGSLPGARCGFEGKVGQPLVVMVRNGHAIDGATPTHEKDMLDMADDIDWEWGFIPQYGMASF